MLLSTYPEFESLPLVEQLSQCDKELPKKYVCVLHCFIHISACHCLYVHLKDLCSLEEISLQIREEVSDTLLLIMFRYAEIKKSGGVRLIRYDFPAGPAHFTFTALYRQTVIYQEGQA